MCKRSLVPALMIAALACGCPGPSDPPDDASSGLDASSAREDATAIDGSRGEDAPAEVRDAPMGDVGPPDSGCACDDGIDCTLDTCVGRGCERLADHARCPEGQYCDPTSGCRSGGPCASSTDCAAPDPCAVPRCDPSLRRCLYSVLDGDRDGEAPIVCGGTDCDDARATISAGAAETCDGTDEDCDARVDEDNADGTTACGDLSVCTAGECVCEIAGGWCPEAFGGGHCRDVMNDAMNCGACHRVCETGRACVDGACACDPGTTYCETTDPFGASIAGCTDTRTDELNCGGCARPCPDGVDCVAGVCMCPRGQTSCTMWGDTAVCVDLMSDEANCGACGVQCPAGVSCTGGRCPCPGGGVYCSPWDEMCIDLAVDTQHCGRCNGNCSNGTCSAGVCACGAGETACPYLDTTGGDYGVYCVDLRSDPTSCGACGRSCGDGRLCTDGRCGSCADGFTECATRAGRICADLEASVEHCGRCGNPCAWPTSRCVEGRCER